MENSTSSGSLSALASSLHDLLAYSTEPSSTVLVQYYVSIEVFATAQLRRLCLASLLYSVQYVMRGRILYSHS